MDKEHLLVDERFAKKDILYLFVFPRTSNAPYFGAMCLYVESVLIWKEIPFYRISNQFFLGSKTDGTIPFAIYNGKYLDGSEKIIEEIRKKGNTYKKLSDENDDIRKFATRTLLKILIADKTFRRDPSIPKSSSLAQLATTSSSSNSAPATPKGGMTIRKKFGPIDIKIPHKNEEIIMAKSEGHSPGFLSKAFAHLKINNNNSPRKGPGGLDWMLTDEGVREQLMPAIPEAFLDPEIQIEISKEESNSTEYFDSPASDKKRKLKKENEEEEEEEEEESYERKPPPIKYGMTLSPQFWKDYFNILNKIKNRENNNEEINLIKRNFIQEYIGFPGRIDWERVNSDLENLINDNLKKLIIDGQMHFCWEKMLREVVGKNINEIDLINKFKSELKSLGIIKKLREAEINNNFLHGANPTLADFALFAFLNQFFEFPLNIPEFKEIFTTEKINNEEKEIDGNLFKNYIKRIKNNLGKFGDDEVWRIMKERPWPLNFELIEEEGNETFKDKFEGPFNIEVGELTNIHTLLDTNNPENLLNNESNELKKELKKKGWWTDSEYSRNNNNNQQEEIEEGPSERMEKKKINLGETSSSNVKEEEILKEIKKEKSKLGIIINKDKQIVKDFLLKSPKIEKQKYLFENEIVLHSIEKILQKLINKYNNQKIFGKLMILEMASFICNLGKNKLEKEGKECKEKHEKIKENYLNENKEFLENYFEENDESFDHQNFTKETKKLVHQAIIEYIEGKIASKVRYSISNTAALNIIDVKHTQENKDEF
uniref:GST_C domain-containing protein n=1 Tax=Meloidogyne hapla TaxID=6305 RepID=A0A1I8B4M8_MELHA